MPQAACLMCVCHVSPWYASPRLVTRRHLPVKKPRPLHCHLAHLTDIAHPTPTVRTDDSHTAMLALHQYPDLGVRHEILGTYAVQTRGNADSNPALAVLGAPTHTEPSRVWFYHRLVPYMHSLGLFGRLVAGAASASAPATTSSRPRACPVRYLPVRPLGGWCCCLLSAAFGGSHR